LVRDRGPEKELTHRLTALLLPEEAAAVEVLRRKDGRTASSYVRHLIRSAVEAAKKAKLITDRDIAAAARSIRAKKG